MRMRPVLLGLPPFGEGGEGAQAGLEGLCPFTHRAFQRYDAFHGVGMLRLDGLGEVADLLVRRKDAKLWRPFERGPESSPQHRRSAAIYPTPLGIACVLTTDVHAALQRPHDGVAPLFALVQ